MDSDLRRMTDHDLARMTLSGSRKAFEEIVRRYHRPLILFTFARMASRQDAEDIVQETFLRAYRKIGSFSCKYSLQNWLFTIAYRLIVSDYRKRKPQLLSDKAVNQLSTQQSEGPDNQWLWKMAGGLGPEGFTVLWLRYKLDLSTDEIAEIMQKTNNMVCVLLHRTRRRLAKRIAEQPAMPQQPRWLQSRLVSFGRTK